MQFKRAIWWIKRDFRLDDNPALTLAIQQAQEVIPCFFFDEVLTASDDASDLHIKIQRDALLALQEELAEENAIVAVFNTEVITGLDRLSRSLTIDVVFTALQPETALERERTKHVRLWCEKQGIAWIETTGIHDKHDITSKQREHSWRDILFSTPLPRVETVPQNSKSKEIVESLCDKLPSEPRTVSDPQLVQRVTSAEAQLALATFLSERGESYFTGINSPNAAAYVGSRLSPHLSWGTISIRRVYRATEERIGELEDLSAHRAELWRRSLKAFRSRLLWHTQFQQRFWENPDMEFAPLAEEFAALPFQSDNFLLSAWILGHTGVPLIDACMRCLRATGFLNFRMRAMITSFACHIFQLPWHSVMRPLAGRLADYNPPIHINQVQVQAGVAGFGSVRIFDPFQELLDHDPGCHFVRRWVPELRTRSDNEIKFSSSRLIPGYSQALVDFHKQRQATRRAFQLVRVRKTKGRWENHDQEERSSPAAIFLPIRSLIH
jgi:deoxyribodipyrimidine photo-lyase